jgi:hypothetical protein
MYDIDLTDESDRRVTVLTALWRDSTVDTLHRDYSDYDLSNPESLISIASLMYLDLQAEEAPDFDVVFNLIENAGNYETE